MQLPLQRKLQRLIHKTLKLKRCIKMLDRLLGRVIVVTIFMYQKDTLKQAQLMEKALSLIHPMLLYSVIEQIVSLKLGCGRAQSKIVTMHCAFYRVT